jgi:hypothetical protein
LDLLEISLQAPCARIHPGKDCESFRSLRKETEMLDAKAAILHSSLQVLSFHVYCL